MDPIGELVRRTPRDVDEGGAMSVMVRLAGWLVAFVLSSAAAGGVAEAKPTAPPIPDEAYFGPILLPRDEQGVEVPIRNGDATLGYAKAWAKHNFCSVSAMALAIRGSGNKQPPEGSRVVYRAHAVGDGFDVVLRVVVDTRRVSQRGPTPDGRPIGMITAYCEGMFRCPDALNQT